MEMSEASGLRKSNAKTHANHPLKPDYNRKVHGPGGVICTSSSNNLVTDHESGSAETQYTNLHLKRLAVVEVL